MFCMNEKKLEQCVARAESCKPDAKIEHKKDYSKLQIKFPNGEKRALYCNKKSEPKISDGKKEQMLCGGLGSLSMSGPLPSCKK